MATRFVFDTTVFIYAIGGEHLYRDPCRGIVARAQREPVEGGASAQVIQELAHLVLRRTGDGGRARAEARAAAAFCRPVYDLEWPDLQRALDLVARAPGLDVADAVSAATALNRGIGAILSADRDFDAVPELERIDPADARAVEALLG